MVTVGQLCLCLCLYFSLSMAFQHTHLSSADFQRMGIKSKVNLPVAHKPSILMHAAPLTTHRPNVDLVAESPHYIALAEALSKPYSYMHGPTVLTPHIIHLMESPCMSTTDGWEPMHIVNLLLAARLSRSNELSRRVWTASTPIIVKLLSNMNARGLANVLYALEYAVVPAEESRWLIDLLADIAAAISMNDMTGWSPQYITMCLAGLSNVSPNLNQAMDAVLTKMTQIPANFEPNDLLFLISRYGHGRQPRENVIDHVLARIPESKGWKPFHVAKTMQSLRGVSDLYGANRQVLHELAEKLRGIPVNSTNIDPLLALPNLAYLDSFCPETRELMEVIEPHLLAGLSSGAATCQMALQAIGSFRFKDFSMPSTSRILNALKPLLQRPNETASGRDLCFALSGLARLGNNSAEIADIVDALTTKLNDSTLMLQGDEVLDAVGALRSLDGKTPAFKSLCSVLANAIRRSNVPLMSTGYEWRIFYLPHDMPVHLPEVRSLLNALSKALDSSKAPLRISQYTYSNCRSMDFQIPEVRAFVRSLLTRPCRDVHVKFGKALQLATELNDDAVKIQTYELLTDLLLKTNRTVSLNQLSPLVKPLQTEPENSAHVLGLLRALTPRLPTRIAFGTRQYILKAFQNMPSTIPEVQQFQRALGHGPPSVRRRPAAIPSSLSSPTDPFSSKIRY